MTELFPNRYFYFNNVAVDNNLNGNFIPSTSALINDSAEDITVTQTYTNASLGIRNTRATGTKQNRPDAPLFDHRSYAIPKIGKGDVVHLGRYGTYLIHGVSESNPIVQVGVQDRERLNVDYSLRDQDGGVFTRFSQNRQSGLQFRTTIDEELLYRNL